MKVNRLFSIVHILLNKKKVTAKELANKFEVSTRTIYRDIECLSMSGIPVFTDKGTGGGISLLDNYVLNKSIISEEEKNSILLGLEVLRATNCDDVDTAIDKLRNLFDRKKDNYIEVDFSSFDNDSQTDIFEKIKASIEKSITLEIIYRNDMGEKSERKIDPIKLIFKHQRWYVIAYCHKRQDYRTFRISRIFRIKLTSEEYNRNKYDISNMTLTSYSRKNIKSITLTFNIKALYRVEEEFHKNMIVYEDDKVLVVRFETELDDWITNYIMTYADYLINIEPTYLKEIIKNKARKLVAL